MAHELPEFSDDLAHCDPCGWPEADTEYVPAIAGPVAIERRVNPFGGGWPVFAFLKRTCTRCGFQWAEAPLPPRQEDAPNACEVGLGIDKMCVLDEGHTGSHRFGPLKHN